MKGKTAARAIVERKCMMLVDQIQAAVIVVETLLSLLQILLLLQLLLLLLWVEAVVAVVVAVVDAIPCADASAPAVADGERKKDWEEADGGRYL